MAYWWSTWIRFNRHSPICDRPHRSHRDLRVQTDDQRHVGAIGRQGGLRRMISATEILARSTLLIEDHLAASVPSVDIAQSFADTTVGLILDAALLRHPPFVVALETLRVLLAGMCVGIRLEVRGKGEAPRLGP